MERKRAEIEGGKMKNKPAEGRTVGHTPGPWQADVFAMGGILIYQHGPSLGKSGNSEDCPVVARLMWATEADARLMAAAPSLLEVLIQAVEESGFSLSGPTDHRAAEDGEPKWVCNARAAIAIAESRATPNVIHA